MIRSVATVFPGGIRLRFLATLSGVLVACLVSVGLGTASVPGLVTETVHFEIPATDVIPLVASFRASCDVLASGEDLWLPSNDSVRTTIGAVPGNCSMVLNLLGFDVPISTIATTPLGEVFVYIPGVSIVSLGVVDISLSLRTTLNSTTRVTDPAWAAVEPQHLTWTFWGTQRVLVQSARGFGSLIPTELSTTFTYAMILSLSVLAFGVPIPGLQANLVDFGAHDGVPSLVTDLVVDLLPIAPILDDPAQVTFDGATLSWTLNALEDMDHVEVWITDGALNASYRIEDAGTTSLRLPLQPQTTYRAWIVAVDDAGQTSASRLVSFTTPAAPSDNGDGGVQPQGEPPLLWILVALLVGGVVVGFLAWSLRREPKD